MKEVVLKVAQTGCAAGEAFLLKTETKPETAEVTDGNAELAKFYSAVSALDCELADSAANSDGEAAAIFEAERILLKDPKYAEMVRQSIENDGMSSVSAVEKAGNALAAEIRRSGTATISQRGGDLNGLTERLVSLLRGEEKDIPTHPFILAAGELSPAQLSAVNPERILGIVTAKGSPASHVSIIAGNLGVPYYYGSEEAIAEIGSGVRLVLDSGRLILDPDEETYRMTAEAMNAAKDEKKRKKAATESAGTRTRVLANISGPQDIPALITSGMDGIGLFRTELLFLNGTAAPSEEEQFQAYRRVAEAMAGKETVIRTMDLGSDKQSAWLSLPGEKNPALGCRGLRVSLQEEALFKTQLRALLRASVYGNVRVMIPMVTSGWEVDKVRELVAACAQELSDEGVPYRLPPLGIMVETPAAAITADRLAEKADFFSIGTNDLTQYTLALDREAVGLENYYDPCHEAVLHLIEMTAAAGHRHKIPTAICGELAANPDIIERLIELGVDELSVSVSKVSTTKAVVREAEERLFRKGREPEPVSLAAPADGMLVPMKDIPDPAFSSGILGECAGIEPENGKVYAPCDGTVSSVAETKHAVTLLMADGRKILIHAGIDTVQLRGEGFTVFVREGDAVAAGDLLLEADLEKIREAGLSPMVITACCP